MLVSLNRGFAQLIISETQYILATIETIIQWVPSAGIFSNVDFLSYIFRSGHKLLVEHIIPLIFPHYIGPVSYYVF